MLSQHQEIRKKEGNEHQEEEEKNKDKEITKEKENDNNNIAKISAKDNKSQFNYEWIENGRIFKMDDDDVHAAYFKNRNH